MTNKEILQSDLLDILFEHRNKLYGAYALRKDYNFRLGKALAISLSIVLLLVLSSFLKNKKSESRTHAANIDSVMLRIYEIPKPEPEIEDPRPKPETAQRDFQTVVVVPDEIADPQLIENEELVDANVGNENIDGDPPTEIVKPGNDSTGNAKEGIKEKEPEPDFNPVERQPQFPGGTEAWIAFLRKFLQSPDDLEAGQRIEVYVRFLIDIDGSISRPEIIKSGGTSFDKEVLRVMKKMPKWEPAFQNGNKVAVAYTQPVIFVGAEE